MKKIITFLIIAITFFSCISANEETSPEAEKINAIETMIDNNAMGMDIGYKAGKLDTVIIVNAEQSIKDLEGRFEDHIDSMLPVFTGLYEQDQMNGDIKGYHMWKWQAERADKLPKMQPKDIEYSVYKYTYSINNLIDSTKRVTVENYYFFNQNDSLVGYYDSDRFNYLKLNFIQSDLQPYETGLFLLMTGLDKDL